eukprot:TRINITY_DN6160_c0_g1_i1.p1 TRINITY_DN6160_c0_g1~~TRINITY_DN6160_c0_g1_i1.p1  ORF type:complete len:317 (+),score=19.00 TRINITY_DN6160_c0_g1_i1:64-951(+)
MCRYSTRTKYTADFYPEKKEETRSEFEIKGLHLNNVELPHDIVAALLLYLDRTDFVNFCETCWAGIQYGDKQGYWQRKVAVRRQALGVWYDGLKDWWKILLSGCDTVKERTEMFYKHNTPLPVVPRGTEPHDQDDDDDDGHGLCHSYEIEDSYFFHEKKRKITHSVPSRVGFCPQCRLSDRRCACSCSDCTLKRSRCRCGSTKHNRVHDDPDRRHRLLRSKLNPSDEAPAVYIKPPTSVKPYKINAADPYRLVPVPENIRIDATGKMTFNLNTEWGAFRKMVGHIREARVEGKLV